MKPNSMRLIEDACGGCGLGRYFFGIGGENQRPHRHRQIT